MTEPVFVSVEELAARLGVKRTTIYMWTSRRGPDSIPRVRLGRRYGFALADVIRWLKEQGADGSRPGARIRRMPARGRTLVGSGGMR